MYRCKLNQAKECDGCMCCEIKETFYEEDNFEIDEEYMKMKEILEGEEL